jgi:ketosteroid isomerase-like protein
MRQHLCDEFSGAMVKEDVSGIVSHYSSDVVYSVLSQQRADGTVWTQGTYRLK